MEFTVTRNGKEILKGSWKKQKDFFFNLYFFLLGMCGNGEIAERTIRENYTLTSNMFGKEKIYW